MPLEVNERKIGIRGEVFIEVHDADTGELIEKRHIENLVTTFGADYFLSQYTGGGGGITVAVQYQHCGTGDTAAVVADTTMDTDLASKIANEKTTGSVSATERWHLLKFFWTRTEGNGTWKEAGLSPSASDEKMCARVVFGSPITKSTSNTITLSWKITIDIS